ncbi:restriction endonuclease subunit S [Leptolyngbya sp. FACHB-671]|uniref:restriction endonuclease subunit S n=1 Tax=Leptolyngbya sp. FACHB-671 TaxID=2692812 RepID=UPI00168923D2|nr:restriction endonuclease subunit S [Leptolyngbya sp. FACHB-671]MBD2070289.1 restriction endonuclease subunit S [Leptolyngbya sp. FACHB-671]
MILPKNWSLVSLSEIAASGRGTFSNGPFGSDLVKSDLTDVGIPVIYIRDIRDGYYDRVSASCVTEEKAEQLSACWVKPGDVLIAKVGDPPGTAAVYPEDQPLGIVTQDVIRLRLNSEIADSQYVRNWLNSPLGKHAVKSITVEATRARFPLGDFKNLKLPLPPIAEQRRIAAILDRADAVRRKRQEAIRLTEELLRSAFLEMFGDPATNPKNWKTSVLREVCRKVTDGTHHMPNTVEDGIPILRALNIKNDRVDKTDLLYISKDDYQKISKRSPLEKGDVLLTCLGTVGNVAIFNEESSFSLVRNIALLKPNYEKLTSEFLKFLLKTNYLQMQIKSRSKQSSQAALYIGEIEQLKVFVPDLELQRKFSELSKKIYYELCRKLEQDKSHQENLFNSLLQRAFRGEL